MATTAFIRGWINATDETAEQIRDLVLSAIDGAEQQFPSDQYREALKQCWHFPASHGPASDFVLIGMTINVKALPFATSLFECIAAKVVDDDGGEAYPIAGRIEVTIDGNSEDQHWIIADGRLDRSRTLPRLLSP